MTYDNLLLRYIYIEASGRKISYLINYILSFNYCIDKLYLKLIAIFRATFHIFMSISNLIIDYFCIIIISL